MKKLHQTILILPLIALMASCSGAKKEAAYPQNPDDRRREARGKLTGEDGLVIFGKENDEESVAAGIGINSYLWRASLDTVSFMPLSSADPFGGVILTDWYENPETPGERFKVDILILSRKLRTNALKVAVFKQALDSKGQWRDVETNETLAREMEDKILTRARELRIQG